MQIRSPAAVYTEGCKLGQNSHPLEKAALSHSQHRIYCMLSLDLGVKSRNLLNEERDLALLCFVDKKGSQHA